MRVHICRRRFHPFRPLLQASLSQRDDDVVLFVSAFSGLGSSGRDNIKATLAAAGAAVVMVATAGTDEEAVTRQQQGRQGSARAAEAAAAKAMTCWGGH